ncbi:hypothetical protein UFOVP695_32 [uncultured Caudovirales phage]|uniref:Uncharacterized protein n=1 Tax=uncultured Caudovirales phage TaxID=2100421 RepID=A0A6J5NKB5_9CAUD|nr:hypothetical protein UFOVP695_32 [uncultured Caudovirales phage]
MGYSKNKLEARWDIIECNNYTIINKTINGFYTLDDIKILSKKYKYIYKATNQFRSLQSFDGEYCKYILTDILLDYDFIYFFNSMNKMNGSVFRYINKLEYFIIIYKLKDKIEIL